MKVYLDLVLVISALQYLVEPLRVSHVLQLQQNHQTCSGDLLDNFVIRLICTTLNNSSQLTKSNLKWSPWVQSCSQYWVPSYYCECLRRGIVPPLPSGFFPVGIYKHIYRICHICLYLSCSIILWHEDADWSLCCCQMSDQRPMKSSNPHGNWDHKGEEVGWACPTDQASENVSWSRFETKIVWDYWNLSSLYHTYLTSISLMLSFHNALYQNS